MALKWIHESSPKWDEDKERIVGQAPEGIFDSELIDHEIGDKIADQWWRVEEDGDTVGYGWMDVVWGDAEVLLAVDPEKQGQGIGTYIVEQLKEEAREKGINYLYNVVPEYHPEKHKLAKWLKAQGFEPSEEDKDLLKAFVKGDPTRES